MNIQLLENFKIEVYGFGGRAANKDYAGTAFRLSGKMWETIKKNNIANKGKNIWIYENDDKVFAGVETESEPDIATTGLEKHTVLIDRYAWYKHTGPYRLIKDAGQQMRQELQKMGLQVLLPYIEIYGHWTGDENTAETELVMGILRV